MSRCHGNRDDDDEACVALLLIYFYLSTVIYCFHFIREALLKYSQCVIFYFSYFLFFAAVHPSFVVGLSIARFGIDDVREK
jgi:hypothetical protein